LRAIACPLPDRAFPMPERGAAGRPVHVLRLDRPTAPFRRADLPLGDCMQSPAGNGWMARGAAWTPSSLSVIARNHLSAPIERLWRSLRYDCVYLHAWETGSQARAGVGRWIAATPTGGPTPPMADSRPPWSASTPSKPISRCRQRLKSAGNLSEGWGAPQIWRRSWPTRRSAEVVVFDYINGF
jgi:hypothetical protein